MRLELNYGLSILLMEFKIQYKVNVISSFSRINTKFNIFNTHSQMILPKSTSQLQPQTCTQQPFYKSLSFTQQ